MKYFLVTPVGFGAISRNQIFHAIKQSCIKAFFDEPEFITFTDASLSQKNKIFFP
jgi:hypothetical protein